MDTINVELKGSEIESIERDGDRLTILFSRAFLLKTMTGSEEKTRWWQAGSLVIEGAEARTPLPIGPQICVGGDIEENIYTYRDMIPIPFESRGHVGCELRFEGRPEPLIVVGTAVRLNMQGTPKYIEHLRPQSSIDAG
ncbi:hypothetical protein [Thiocystis violacea]|uniref:hypothetical protein n=1 Tax=Thiocystis violacea TaxID=13725 RepID=UPI00190321EB|nr:hypothetical protein [Thiocystis violacea]MBK1722087.1 hypothetical protein [Thiocystis violacea]